MFRHTRVNCVKNSYNENLSEKAHRMESDF